MRGRFNLRRTLLYAAAPVLAIAFAALVTSVILVIAGDPVGEVWQTIFTPPSPRNLTNIVNAASIYYLSAIAVAVGFRMNLFNIGVDGQYRLAAFAAAWVAGEAWLPGALNTMLAIATAIFVGAAWAGIAGVLKVTRGVSEVISTIMLNAISIGLVAYLLRTVAVREEGSNIIGTKPIPEGSRVPGIPLVADAPNSVYGLIALSVLAGVVYWLLLGRTRFGFDLRAAGASQAAAVASGVNVKRMIVIAMLISGGLAGLVGLPILFGEAFTYSTSFQPGLGFAGIAIALLGRNNPIGIALGALLFAYLDEQTNPLQISVGVSDEIVKIIQGTIVLAVVIAYELVRRYSVAQEQRQVARELAEQRGAPAEEVPA